jgi:copper chaperone CopZ
LKTLVNSDVNGAKQNVPDLKVFGDGDTFKLICKASSESEGWMKSTKAMEIQDVGCVVQVTTQQRNIDGSYSIAEAVTFVPGVKIVAEVDTSDVDNLKVIGRKLVWAEAKKYE